MLIRSLIAVAAGFAMIAGLTAVTTLLTRWLIPSWTRMPPSRDARIFNLAASCLYSGIGGTVVARLAPVSPLVHSLILALIVLLLSFLAVSELHAPAEDAPDSEKTASTPAAYSLALAVLPAVATLGAGILTVLARLG